MGKNSYHSGWEYFTPDPGEHEKMFCRVCNSEMDVERAVMGPTGFAEAMSVHYGKSKGHLHDTFKCPYAHETWHCQARILKQKILDEPSRVITTMLQAEVDEILARRKVTKEGPWEHL